MGSRRASLLALSALLTSTARLVSRTSFSPFAQLGLTMSIVQHAAIGLSDESAVRQRFWDAPSIAHEWNTIWNGLLGELDQARLIALKAPHSSDWLFALPITFRGRCLSDEAIRVPSCCRSTSWPQHM